MDKCETHPVAVAAAVMPQLCQPSPDLAFLEDGSRAGSLAAELEQAGYGSLPACQLLSQPCTKARVTAQKCSTWAVVLTGGCSAGRAWDGKIVTECVVTV